MSNLKSCSNCRQQVDEQAKFCPICGCGDFSTAETELKPESPGPIVVQAPDYPQNEGASQINGVTPTVAESKDENILAGVVGAFLLSLIGGLLYFVLYQIGIIAGICGLVIFVLANFGYGLFSKSKSRASVANLVTSIVMMVVMIFLSEYICISFEIYKVYKEIGISFFDAVRATPEFLTDGELAAAVIEDLVFAYIFGFIASISNISKLVKERKAMKNAAM